MNRAFIFLAILFSFIQAQKLCEEYTELDSFNGTINSSSYPSGHQCTWNITAPSSASGVYFNIKFIDTELNFDYIRIYNGSSTNSSQEIYQISGSDEETVYFPYGSSYVVQFTSDEAINGAGFLIDYWFDACDAGSCGPEGYCNTDQKQCVCSPGRTGPACKDPSCSGCVLTNGVCVSNTCVCQPGWSGYVCDHPYSEGAYTKNDLEGRIVDHHGYSASGQDHSILISPSFETNAGASHLIFIQFKILDLPDSSILRVYDGVNKSAPLLAAFGSGNRRRLNVNAYSGNVYLDYTGSMINLNGNAGYDIDYKSFTCSSCNSTNGLCQSNGTCKCLPGWGGDSCSQRSCVENNCWDHGTCETNGTCICSNGWDGIDCSVCNTNSCKTECNSSLTESSGLVNLSGNCTVSVDLNASTVYFFSNKPSPSNFTTVGLDRTSVYDTNSLFPLQLPVRPTAYISTLGSNAVSLQYHSSFCPGNCSGNGLCYDGVCTCNAGFLGNNCSQATCLNDCSGDGTCVNGVCNCVKGWGVDCSQTFCSGTKTIVLSSTNPSVTITDHTEGQYSSPNSQECRWVIQSPEPVSIWFDMLSIGDSLLTFGNQVNLGLGDGGQNYVNMAPFNLEANSTIRYFYLASTSLPSKGFRIQANLLSNCAGCKNGACAGPTLGCKCFLGWSGPKCDVNTTVKITNLNSTQTITGVVKYGGYDVYRLSLFRQSFQVDFEQSEQDPYNTMAVLYATDNIMNVNTDYFFTIFYSFSVSQPITAQDFYLVIYGSTPTASAYSITASLSCPSNCGVYGGYCDEDTGTCICTGCYTGPSCQNYNNTCLDRNKPAPSYSRGDVAAAIFGLVVVILVIIGVGLCIIAVAFKLRQAQRQERIRRDHNLNAMNERNHGDNDPPTVELEVDRSSVSTADESNVTQHV